MRDYIPGAAEVFLAPPSERGGRAQESLGEDEIARIAERVEADLPDPG